MALVGEAHIVVRAISTSVNRDIQRAFSGTNAVGRRAGESMGDSFSRGFNSRINASTFTRIANGIRSMVPGADAARASFQNLVRSGYALGTGLSSILGGIFSVISGLGALAGSAGGAIASLSALGNVLFSVGAGMGVARLALGGVGKAVSALTKPAGGGGGGGGGGGITPTQQIDQAATERARAAAVAAANEQIEDAEKSLARIIQRNREELVKANNDVREAQLALNQAFKDGREEIQQLGFDAEDAALAEQDASLTLEKARETLARVQDLPPNSRVRREAELAYQKAELDLRKAKDRSADLNKEQDRLARTGVAGTQAVIDATNDLAEAEADKSKTIRDGAEDEADAMDAIAKARANAAEAAKKQQDAAAKAALAGGAVGGAGGGGVNPFEGLNDAQIKFAKFIASLKPKFDELKKIAAESFLPPLQTAIEILMDKAFPVVATGVGILGAAMGQAAISLARAATEGENLADLSVIFESSGRIIESLGRAMGEAYDAALSILVASAPAAERFIGFLENSLGNFSNFLDTKQASGELQSFFDTSADIMAQIGRIFSNIFGGFGAIIEANFGPGTGGQFLLDWLESATQSFNDLNADADGASGLKQYFLDAAQNAQAVLSAVGALLGEFIKLGANKDIKTTFDTLKEGAPALGELITKSAEAGPALADLVVVLVEVANALADTGAIEVFFDTLTGIASVLRDAFANETVGPILTATGRILAFLSALGLVGKIGVFGFKVLSGSITAFVGPIGAALTGITKLRQAFALMTYSGSAVARVMGTIGSALMNPVGLVKSFALVAKNAALATGALIKNAAVATAAAAKTIALAVAEKAVAAAKGIATAAQWLLNAAMTANPIGIIIAAIAALVAGLIWFFTQTELGQEIWAEFTRFLGEAWTNIVNVGVAVFEGLASFFTDLWNNIGSFFEDALQFIVDLFLNWSILGIIISNWDGITQFFTDVWNNIVSFFEGALQVVVDLFMNWTVFGIIIQNWEGIVGFFTDVWNNIVGVIETAVQFVVFVVQTYIGVVVTFWTNVWNGILAVIDFVWNLIVTAVTIYIQTVLSIITTIVNTIMTVWNTVWTAISDFFSGIWNGIQSFVQTAITTVAAYISTGIALVKLGWEKVWNGIRTFFENIWNGIKSFVDTAIKAVKTTIDNVTGTIKKVWESIWGGIRDFFKGIWDGIVNKVKDFKSTFEGVFGGIKGFVETAFNGVVGAVKGPINGVIGLVNNAINALNKLSVTIPDWVPLVGGQTWGLDIPTIPKLAKGGVVMPSPGGSIVNVAEAGKPERVEPLDPDGLSARDRAMMEVAASQGTINIYVTPTESASAEEIAEEVNRLLAFKQRKGSIS